jgi:tetratricopeptide (TPR) repeat protein
VNRLGTHALGLLLASALLVLPATAPALSSNDLIKQGVQALRDGKNKDALDLFTKAERLDPNSAKPHYYIAAALERLEYPDSAKVQYNRALQADPKYTDALVGLGNLLRTTGLAKGDSAEVKQGTARLEQAVKYSSKDPYALYALGQAYLKDKRYNDAQEIFQKGTYLKQGRARFLDGLGLSLEGKGEIKQAEEILIRARETDPKDAHVRMDLGGFYMRKKIPFLAAPEYGAAAELDPKDPEAHFLYGKALVGSNQFNEGLREFQTAIKIDTTYAPAYLESGRLYYRAKRPQDAAEQFRAYTGFRPDDPVGYFELGRALAQAPQDQSAMREATVVLEKAYELGYKSPELLRLLGKLNFELKDNEQAMLYYGMYASRADSIAPDEKLRIGTLFVANQDSAKAIPLLQKAAEEDTSLAKDANFQLGYLYFSRHDYASAIPYFNKTLDYDPSFMPALLNLGLAKLQVQDKNGALETLRRALIVNPKEVRAYNWIGQTLLTMDDPDSLVSAVEVYREAIAIDSTNADSWRGAGLAYLLQKNCTDADPYFEKATQLEPDHIQGRVWLAQSYSQCGELAKAKEEFNKVLASDPTNEQAGKGLELIRNFEEQQRQRSAGPAGASR